MGFTILRKNTFILTVLATLLFLSASAFASHNAIIAIDPSIANCSELGNTFTVNVGNSAASTDAIFEVRIYTGTSGITEFACGPAPTGWQLFDFTQNYGYCEYKTQASGPYIIAPGQATDFSFDATMNSAACASNFLISTLDNAQPIGEHQYTSPQVRIDCAPPVVIKAVGEPKIACTTGDCNYYITQNTTISVSGYDNDTSDGTTPANRCDVGLNYCEYSYTVNGTETYGPYQYNDGNSLNFEFQFPQDSRHDVQIKCVDLAENETVVNETDFVETVPPITTKTYSPDAYRDGAREWISTNTDVSLNASDPTPHPSGVNGTWYRVIPAPNTWCENPEQYCIDYPEEQTGERGFLHRPYTGPFQIPESCHYIDFYSVDNLGNQEPIMKNGPQYGTGNWQCAFVDGTPPVLTKTVGQPNIPIRNGFDYWVSQQTPIQLHCEDTGPHPSNHVTIHWSYTVDDGTPITGEFLGTDYNLSFAEDSVHELDAWCTDAVGNTSPHDVETFRVDGTPPELSKEMLGTQGTDWIGNCPPETENDVCYVADNGNGGVHVSVTDPDPTEMGCNSNEATCSYELWWDATREQCAAAEGEYYPDTQKCLLESGEFNEQGRDILFHQDSTHTLVINCQDALGNAMPEDQERFLVDSTPPTTVKTYGEPTVTRVGFRWITSQTPIDLNATDAKVGVDKIYYNVTLEDIPEEACNEQCYLQDEPGLFSEYTGPFTIPESSCHAIRFYSTDLLGNTEDMQTQCVFVDNTAPSGEKTVGEPKIAGDENSFDWWVSGTTPITLDCVDQEPHPSSEESVCYRVSFDDPETPWLTESYCNEFGGIMEEDWCCAYTGEERGSSNAYSLSFTEDSMHDLEFYCKDGLGNSQETTDLEFFKVDSTPPTTTKTYEPEAYLDPETGFEYIDTVNRVQLTSVDGGEVCAIGTGPIFYRVSLADDAACRNTELCAPNERTNGWLEYSEPFGIPEESCHRIEYYGTDALGNAEAVQAQCVFVDKTPPVTTKTYSEPQFPIGDVHPKWISSATNISLSTLDPEPHPSGTAETYYRVTQLENDAYCNYADSDEFNCQDAQGEGEFLEYIGESFNIPEQSCHLIEYYSVDHVNKTETTNKQCTFVDNTPPEPTKTVGEPKTQWNGADSVFYPEIANQCWQGENPLECWKVTLLTPISLDCSDPAPHPVGNERVCFYAELDGDNATSSYCERYKGEYNANGDGFCCMNQTLNPFFFTEETEHNLQYYCEDALGNRGSIDDEKFKVEGTAFEITINKKWNLVSVPFVLIDSNIQKVLESINDSIDGVWTYDAFTNQWYVYRPANPGASNLFTLEPGNGYWVSALQNDVLTIGGSLFSPITLPPDKPIKPGWNMIGYFGTDGATQYNGPEGNGKPAEDELRTLCDKWASLLTYWEPDNPNQWHLYDYDDNMDAGAGYWLFATEDGTYAYASTNCGGD